MRRPIAPPARRTVLIELSRDDGTYCDEPTFTVVDRPVPAEHALPLQAIRESGQGAPNGSAISVASVGPYTIAMPDVGEGGQAFAGIVVRGPAGIFYSAAEDVALLSSPPEPDRLPAPDEMGEVFVLRDRPRVIPPEWGATTPPKHNNKPDSGWRLEPKALDIYLTFAGGDHDVLRSEVLSLTGRPPLPPRWTFGFSHSRYYPYTSDTVIETIDEYEERGIHVLFNDHPEPKGDKPLDAQLFSYREQSLTGVLEIGLDGWWFDRNWEDIIDGPVPGLETAVWGQKLYSDIISRHDPTRRVSLLSMYARRTAKSIQRAVEVW